MGGLTNEDVVDAARRTDGHVRRVPVIRDDRAGRWLALEYMQHTGSFKARGAQNLLSAHREAGALPEAGVTIASGGNAGLACAWAARSQGVTATVFLPRTAPAVKVARLRGYGAEVRLVGAEYAEAAEASEAFARESGALCSHAYDNPLIAAGAGTLVGEIRAQSPEVETIFVSVGGGGLFAGVATAAAAHGIRVVAVEPERCCALHAALEAGEPIDVTVDSVAADSLGARRATALALDAAQRIDTRSMLVSDMEIIAARRAMWEERRIVVEHGTAAALAGLAAYRAAEGERIVVVLCGANTDPSDLLPQPPAPDHLQSA